MCLLFFLLVFCCCCCFLFAACGIGPKLFITTAANCVSFWNLSESGLSSLEQEGKVKLNLMIWWLDLQLARERISVYPTAGPPRCHDVLACTKATCRVGMCMMLADQAEAPGRTSSHSSSAGSPPGRPGTQWCVDSSYVQPGATSAPKMSWKCGSSPSTHRFIPSVGFYGCHLVLRKLSNMRTERYLKPTHVTCR